VRAIVRSPRLAWPSEERTADVRPSSDTLGKEAMWQGRGAAPEQSGGSAPGRQGRSSPAAGSAWASGTGGARSRSTPSN